MYSFTIQTKTIENSCEKNCNGGKMLRYKNDLFKLKNIVYILLNHPVRI